MENQAIMYVKIITLRQREDGRFQIVGVTDFMPETEINIEPDNPRFAVVPDFNEPPQRQDKIAESFYDRETGLIHTEYRDIGFSDFPMPIQIRKLREENDELNEIVDMLLIAGLRGDVDV